jgi:uncharacterized protein
MHQEEFVGMNSNIGSEIATPAKTKSKRGFAAMADKDYLRAIARKGGIAAHQKGTAHEFTSDEARLAGSKGGKATAANGGHHNFNK